MLKYLEPYRMAPQKPLLNVAKSFNVNIKAENELEENNINSVVATMNEVMRTPTVVDGAIMPDACPTGSIGTIPVGGVVLLLDEYVLPGPESLGLISDKMCEISLNLNFEKSPVSLILLTFPVPTSRLVSTSSVLFEPPSVAETTSTPPF